MFIAVRLLNYMELTETGSSSWVVHSAQGRD